MGTPELMKETKPTVGHEITYRMHGGSFRGRVISSTETTALVVPNVQSKSIPTIIHELKRPHTGAPWKGRSLPVGGFRELEWNANPIIWNILLGWPNLIPESWYASLTTKEYTVERLLEVRKKCAVIGIYYGSSIEEKAALAMIHYHSDQPNIYLQYFRENVKNIANDDVAKYLKTVLINDK